MSEPLILDTKMHGRPGLTAAFLVQGEKLALVETGPKSAVDNVFGELERLGIDHLDWIIVTHIHLDHAGAAGTLLKRFPGARVGVHSVGAPHLINPSKLMKSATRIYGALMDQLWGGIDPVPAEAIHVIEDGDEIDLGGRKLTAVEAPGHAYHHHAYLDDSTGACFTGDALGVRLPELGMIRPATPPPEFHLEKAVASIRRIAELGARDLWLTHFGPHDRGPGAGGVGQTCEAAIEALRQWEKWVLSARASTLDLAEAAELVRGYARDRLEGNLDDEDIARLEQTTSYSMNTSGYMRYLDKKEGA